MISLQVAAPAEAIKEAFNRFSFTDLSFETIWPLVTVLLVLGIAFLVKKWVVKQYKELKVEAGIEDDKQD